MKCFLTSSPFLPGGAALDPANGFVSELKKAVPDPCSGLFICSDPADYPFTDGFADMMHAVLTGSGISFDQYNILDDRNADMAAELVASADLIILAGGHVPTQNKFFEEIGLRKIMSTYTGAVIGISAGTMNSADTVYAQPELDGEAVDPNYKRFLTGLGLTSIMVLPHYQAIKDTVLDSLRVFEDISYGDSFGRKFYALPDGSWLYIRDGVTELRGEAYLIQDGVLSKISDVNDVVMLTNEEYA